MNTSSKIPALLRSMAIGAVLSLLTLFFTGCEAFIEVFLDDPEPVQGTYQATVSPAYLELTAANPSQTVTLTAVSVGEHLPPNSDQNQPGWVATSSPNYLVTIADPSSATTTVTVTYVGPPTLESNGLEWDRYSRLASFALSPTSVPAGLAKQTTSLSVRYYFGPDVEDEIAETPRLTVLPAQVSFLPGRTRVLTVVYKGPDAHFTSGGLSQTGSAFSINPSFPDLKDGVSFAVPITYSDTAPASTATFYLNTSNGASAAVPLTGLGL